MPEYEKGNHVGVIPGGKPLKVVEEKRRCDFPTCSTILSRYNPKSVCFAHEAPRYVDPARGIRRKRSASI